MRSRSKSPAPRQRKKTLPSSGGGGDQASSKNGSDGPRLRILSVNACCLPTGLRNSRLPASLVQAGVLGCLALWLLVLRLWLRPRELFHSPRLALPAALLLPPCLCFGVAVATQARVRAVNSEIRRRSRSEPAMPRFSPRTMTARLHCYTFPKNGPIETD